MVGVAGGEWNYQRYWCHHIVFVGFLSDVVLLVFNIFSLQYSLWLRQMFFFLLALGLG